MSESSLFYNNLGTFDVAIFASYRDDIQSLAEFGRIYLQRILSSRNSGTVNRPTTCIMYCYYSIIAFIAAQLNGKCFVTTKEGCTFAFTGSPICLILLELELML